MFKFIFVFIFLFFLSSCLSAQNISSIFIKDIVVDVSEQPIESPKKGQKKYYSGKKNDTP